MVYQTGFGLPAIDQAFFDADVKLLLNTLCAFDNATRRISADSVVTVFIVLPMLIDIRSTLHASLGPKASTIPRPTQAQVDEQLQEGIVRPLVSLVDAASEIASAIASNIACAKGTDKAVGIGAGKDSDDFDSAPDEEDAGCR